MSDRPVAEGGSSAPLEPVPPDVPPGTFDQIADRNAQLAAYRSAWTDRVAYAAPMTGRLMGMSVPILPYVAELPSINLSDAEMRAAQMRAHAEMRLRFDPFGDEMAKTTSLVEAEAYQFFKSYVLNQTRPIPEFSPVLRPAARSISCLIRMGFRKEIERFLYDRVIQFVSSRYIWMFFYDQPQFVRYTERGASSSAPFSIQLRHKPDGYERKYFGQVCLLFPHLPIFEQFLGFLMLLRSPAGELDLLCKACFTQVNVAGDELNKLRVEWVREAERLAEYV